ncbi:MAG TPA: DAK2 domain-containing protein, partial [Streptosporangiaceae bacterium]|nr:DAK2 domain-containing protein [Streptosporangiaceae bacterium]
GNGAGAGETLKTAAAEWSDASGGASGALWGTGLRALGQVIGDENPPTAADMATAVQHWSEEVMRVGGAAPGDKTMVDVLVPFAAALTQHVGESMPLGDAWAEAVVAAEAAAEATKDLVPRVGRARPLAARSAGNPDAGAISLALVLRAVEPVMRRSP